jgi:L-threonylcarbamoyladenylate synthase
MTKICSTIQDDGFGPLIIDGEYGLICSAYSKIGIRRINNISTPHPTFQEVLCADLAMLKAHTLELHPRIETLLLYHERPLKVFIDCPKNLPTFISENGAYLRIVKDPITKTIIKDVGHPLYSKSFLNGNFQITLEEIAKEIKEKGDFELFNDQSQSKNTIPILKIHFDQEGMITILE